MTKLMRATFAAYVESGADTDGDEQWHCTPEWAGKALMHAVETLRKDYDDSLDESTAAEAERDAALAALDRVKALAAELNTEANLSGEPTTVGTELRRILAEHPATGDEERGPLGAFVDAVVADADAAWERMTAEPDAVEGEGLGDVLCLCHETACPVHNENAGRTAEYDVPALLDALASHVAKAKAEALREAADEWQQGRWLSLTSKIRPDRPASIIGAGQVVTDWLGDRADRIAQE